MRLPLRHLITTRDERRMWMIKIGSQRVYAEIASLKAMNQELADKYGRLIQTLEQHPTEHEKLKAEIARLQFTAKAKDEANKVYAERNAVLAKANVKLRAALEAADK